jgi:hypothetical protein
LTAPAYKGEHKLQASENEGYKTRENHLCLAGSAVSVVVVVVAVLRFDGRCYDQCQGKQLNLGRNVGSTDGTKQKSSFGGWRYFSQFNLASREHEKTYLPMAIQTANVRGEARLQFGNSPMGISRLLMLAVWIRASVHEAMTRVTFRDGLELLNRVILV